MKKVLDNTVVSAFGKEIASVELMSLLMDSYGVVVPHDVVRECWEYNDGELIPTIESTEVVRDPRIKDIRDIIMDKYRSLGLGESATLATSVVLTAEGIPNYAVIDDLKARKVAPAVGHIPQVVELVGREVDVNITGTLGLVLHLHSKGLITDEMRRMVGTDLERSPFRISDELLKLFR